MTKKLNRLRSTRDKKRALAEKLVKDVETLDAQIAQLENEEIVKSVREYRMTPEELFEFLQDLHGDTAPTKTTPQEESSDVHETLV